VKTLLFSLGCFSILLCGCKHRIVITGIADQVEQVRSSVVHIEKVGVCQGSGCIISSDGIVFTAKHVTDGGGEFIVTLDDGTKYTTSVCVESVNFDVAFLKIKIDKMLPTVSLANIQQVRVGDPVFIFSSPFGKDNLNSVSLGILSSVQRDLSAKAPYGWRVTFQTDATAAPGSSGGPVFNVQGEVIGVLVAGIVPTINYSVPVSVFYGDLFTIQHWFELSKFEFKKVSPPGPDYKTMFSQLDWRLELLECQVMVQQKVIKQLLEQLGMGELMSDRDGQL
jgi:hypothetical protein